MEIFNSLFLLYQRVPYCLFYSSCRQHSLVIIPLFITPPFPVSFSFPFQPKKRHIKYGKNIIMSALLKTIVADYSATAGTINTVNQVSDCE